MSSGHGGHKGPIGKVWGKAKSAAFPVGIAAAVATPLIGHNWTADWPTGENYEVSTGMIVSVDRKGTLRNLLNAGVDGLGSDETCYVAAGSRILKAAGIAPRRVDNVPKKLDGEHFYCPSGTAIKIGKAALKNNNAVYTSNTYDVVAAINNTNGDTAINFTGDVVSLNPPQLAHEQLLSQGRADEYGDICHIPAPDAATQSIATGTLRSTGGQIVQWSVNYDGHQPGVTTNGIQECANGTVFEIPSK